MKSLLRGLAALAIICSGTALMADAAVKDLPVRSVNGHLYHYYQVPERESVYSVCYKLNVSKEELLKYNPSAADGLKAGMMLYFPYADDPTIEPSQPAQTITHKVEYGETIFGLAHKYGITEEELKAQNPSVRNGLKAGQVLTISTREVKGEAPVPDPQPVPAAAEPQPAPAKTNMTGYVVKKGESLYSIARSFGITEAEIMAANPSLGTLKAGQVLSIPSKETAEDNSADIADVAIIANEEPEPVPAPEPQPAAKPASIAVLLPFMLSEETPSKAALRATEFYKGLLLAADSLRNSSVPVSVTAYDTENSLATLKEILTDSAFRRHTVIIAPDNASQLALVAEYGKNYDVAVFNSFVVRDESYLHNPQMLQANLPSPLMYDKAVSALVERLRRSVPVFLTVAGATQDKHEFVHSLKKRLDSEGIAYQDITVEGSLTPQHLASLADDGNYTFIPTHSRQTELNRLMPGLIEWRDQKIMPIVRLFGYPEWTMFRGETLQNMHNLNTIVYSRFFTDYDSPRASQVEGKFTGWYGAPMESVVPRQGLMGFDAGMFIIPFATSDKTSYDGVQNSYRFTRTDDSEGRYNDTLFFLNFRPGGDILKTAL